MTRRAAKTRILDFLDGGKESDRVRLGYDTDWGKDSDRDKGSDKGKDSDKTRIGETRTGARMIRLGREQNSNSARLG